MKKGKGIFYILLCALMVFASFCFVLPNNSFLFAEEVEEEQEEENNNASVAISSVADLAKMSSNMTKNAVYNLNSDLVIENAEDFTTIAGTFLGTFNGNGYTISGLKCPIFENLGNGAVVSSICIKDGEITISEENASAMQNYGFIAKSAQNATISQVLIENCKFVKGETFGDIISNTNMGFIAGSIKDGTKILNNNVTGCSYNVFIGQCEANIFNFGGLVGYSESATFSNNIVNLYKEQDNMVLKTINFNNYYTKDINFGGLAGKVNSDKCKIYNNAVLFDEKSFTMPEEAESLKIGSITGNVATAIIQTGANGFLTTYNKNFFGDNTNNIYSNLNVVAYSNLFASSILEDKTIWCDIESYSWNSKTVWMKVVGAKLPELQIFNNFTVGFDTEESKKSLNLEKMPSGEVLTYTISTESGESLDNLEYGETVYLTVNITETNNYDDFFYISALELNGEVLYNNVTKQSNNLNISQQVQTDEPEDDEGVTPQNEIVNTYESTCTYKIENFNATLAGTYSVMLGRKSYFVKLNVHDVGTEETGSIIPGKFTTDEITNPVDYTVLELKYGERYIITTNVTNTDYSNKAYWHIFKNNQTLFDEPILFAPVEENANFYSNKLDFTFDENCALFNFEENNVTETEYFSFEDYVTSDENPTQSNYELNIVYVKRVKLVKFVLQDYNDEDNFIKEKAITLLINNKEETLVWNEEEGVYYAKLPFDQGATTTYKISIKEVKTGYEFVDFYFNENHMEKLSRLEDDENVAELEISEETEEPLTIYCAFNVEGGKAAENLLWLWIALGAVAAVGLIVLIIIIIRRKRGGGSSKAYKKYYY